jgi:hypothetical protein
MQLKSHLSSSLDSINRQKNLDHIFKSEPFGSGLVDFIHTETFYSMRRLLPGDLKILYSGPGSGQIPVDRNPFSAEFEPRLNYTKGGVDLGPML